jgi:single-strand DNA-binding protein
MVIGRLGQDPEMKYTPNGKAVTNFSIATDSGFGENKKTEWFRVTCWEKTAEACAQYLAKGSLAYVEGRMETRSWEKDGVKQYRTELIAERVQFLDPKGARESREDYARQEADDIDPDNLPF